jgi:hypothetical protein
VKTGLSGLTNWMIQFFQRTHISVFLSNLAPITLLSCFNCLLSFISILSCQSSMSANEERRVKAKHDVTQFYQRKKDVSRREMTRGVMTISDDPNPDNSSSSSDDDIEDDTYVPSP